MRRLLFSRAAEQDLLDLWEYIAQDNPVAADVVVAEVEAVLQRLREQPSAGHRRPDLTAADVRFWTVRRYLLVYPFDERKLQVVRILSGYRDIESLLL